MKLLITFILLSSACFGQSKKDQIEALNQSLDSLELVLATTRDNSANDMGELNAIIEGLNIEINRLKSDVSNLQTTNSNLTKENDNFKLDLSELSKKNLELEAKLRAIEVDKGEVSADSPIITKSGLGEIKLGGSLSCVPDRFEHKIIEEEGEGGVYTRHYYFLNGKKHFGVTLNEAGKIDMIYIYANEYRTANGFRVDSKLPKFKTLLPNSKAIYFTSYYMMGVVNDGLVFLFNGEDQLAQDLKGKLHMTTVLVNQLPNNLDIEVQEIMIGYPIP